MRGSMLVLVLFSIFFVAAPAAAQPAVLDTAALIRNAEQAAPASIAANARIMTHDGAVLREGTNGWVCMPHAAGAPGNAPMCLDAPWQGFVQALMAKQQPNVTSLGIGYMLQGDFPTSNIDPFATGPTADNQWLENAGPHIMLIVPDPRVLDALPTDPNNGGPWVMWKGTPYAHVMVPAPKLP